MLLSHLLIQLWVFPIKISSINIFKGINVRHGVPFVGLEARRLKISDHIDLPLGHCLAHTLCQHGRLWLLYHGLAVFHSLFFQRNFRPTRRFFIVPLNDKVIFLRGIFMDGHAGTLRLVYKTACFVNFNGTGFLKWATINTFHRLTLLHGPVIDNLVK